MKHTPGAWKWNRTKIGDQWHCILYGQPNEHNDRLVTAMREDLAAFPYAADTANARLIAAAPELLASLTECLAALDQLHREGMAEYYPIADTARAAIAKATQ